MNSIRVLLLLIVSVIMTLCLSACDNGKDKEICVIEQLSPMSAEWEKVILVYGYWDNQDAAEKIMKSWEPLAQRKLRVTPKKLSRSEYNSLVKTIGNKF